MKEIYEGKRLFQGIFFQMETSSGSEKYGDIYIFQLSEVE